METTSNIRSNQPMSIKEIVDANRDRIFITKPDTGVKESDSRQDIQLKKAKGMRM